MSKLLIGQYLNELSRLKQVSGTHRESVVREAFKDPEPATGNRNRAPTIRETLDSYRFADQSDKVIDLLMRLTRVGVSTIHITLQMQTTPRT